MWLGRGAAWSLRKKILLSMAALLLLMGLVTTLTTRVILLKALRSEFQQKGLSLAKSLAANSLVDVLTQRTSRLKQLMDNEKKLDQDIAYAFILTPSGGVLAHTFSAGFPMDLIAANTIEKNKSFNTQLLDTRMGRIYDIAVPIFSGESMLGQVRLGIFQQGIQQALYRINLILTALTFLIIIISIILAYKISALIEEKERLRVLAERERIALDLHDGCAQNMANVIKRVELCERLLKIDPDKAREELNFLKENTREILDKTRKVIFGLKEHGGQSLDLGAELNNFIKDFEAQNNIRVELALAPSLSNIPVDTQDTLFLIITEAFNNIQKHARAKNVTLQLKQDSGNLLIEIRDDGEGFDAASVVANTGKNTKLGLMSMRQRAISLGGVFAINSRPGQGTGISLSIPLTKTGSHG